MRLTPKTIGKISAGLLLIGWLCVVLLRKQPVASALISVGAETTEKTPLMHSPTTMPASHVTASPPADPWAQELDGLRELAAKDPDAALARVAQMREKHERKIAARMVCVVVSKKDPAKAMTAAWRFDLGKFSDETIESDVLETLATQWAGADLGNAFLWASGLPADDESRRDRVMKGIALALAQIAPAEAARVVTERIDPDSFVRVEATIDVLRHWAAQEYAGALAWASLFPEGPLRERSLEALAAIEPAQKRSGPWVEAERTVPAR